MQMRPTISAFEMLRLSWFDKRLNTTTSKYILQIMGQEENTQADFLAQL